MYIIGLFQDEYNGFTQTLNRNKDVSRRNRFVKFPNDYLLMGENGFIKFSKSLYPAIVASKDVNRNELSIFEGLYKWIIRYLLV